MMEKINLNLPDQLLNFNRVSYQTNSEFCLLKWKGMNIAVDVALVASIKLASEISEKTNSQRPIYFLCFNSDFELIEPTINTNQHVLMLNRIDCQIGIYCEQVEFSKSNSSIEIFDIPPSMITQASPISRIIRIDMVEHFDVDLQKLCSLFVSQKKEQQSGE